MREIRGPRGGFSAGQIKRPVLKYHGSKFRIAPWVMQFFPKHHRYVEPFGGGGAVLMRKPRTAVEIYNDLDGEIVNVFRVLRDPRRAARLRRALHRTAYARSEFEFAWNVRGDSVERARRTLVRAWMGIGSDAATRRYRTGFRLKQGGGRASVSDWITWQAVLEQFTARLRTVGIENRDASEVIQRFDGHDALIYADPPYVLSTRTASTGNSGNGYRHEMSDDDHRRLAAVLHSLAGMVVVSGYPSDLYRDLYPNWASFSREARVESGSARTEVVWLNPACKSALVREGWR